MASRVLPCVIRGRPARVPLPGIRSMALSVTRSFKTRSKVPLSMLSVTWHGFLPNLEHQTTKNGLWGLERPQAVLERVRGFEPLTSSLGS